MKRYALVLLVAPVVLLSGCAKAILPGAGPGGAGLTALTVTPSGAVIPGVTQQQFAAKTGDGSKPAGCDRRRAGEELAGRVSQRAS